MVPRFLHVQAAVDGVDLAGDVSRFGVGQELHHPGDLVRFAESAGIRATTLASAAGGTAAVMSVAMNPGVTVLTVMPFQAVSRARLIVSPNRPDLAAA